MNDKTKAIIIVLIAVGSVGILTPILFLPSSHEPEPTVLFSGRDDLANLTSSSLIYETTNIGEFGVDSMIYNEMIRDLNALLKKGEFIPINDQHEFLAGNGAYTRLTGDFINLNNVLTKYNMHLENGMFVIIRNGDFISPTVINEYSYIIEEKSDVSYVFFKPVSTLFSNVYAVLLSNWDVINAINSRQFISYYTIRSYMPTDKLYISNNDINVFSNQVDSLLDNTNNYNAYAATKTIETYFTGVSFPLLVQGSQETETFSSFSGFTEGIWSVSKPVGTYVYTEMNMVANTKLRLIDGTAAAGLSVTYTPGINVKEPGEYVEFKVMTTSENYQVKQIFFRQGTSTVFTLNLAALFFKHGTTSLGPAYKLNIEYTVRLTVVNANTVTVSISGIYNGNRTTETIITDGIDSLRISSTFNVGSTFDMYMDDITFHSLTPVQVTSTVYLYDSAYYLTNTGNELLENYLDAYDLSLEQGQALIFPNGKHSSDRMLESGESKTITTTSGVVTVPQIMTEYDGWVIFKDISQSTYGIIDLNSFDSNAAILSANFYEMIEVTSDIAYIVPPTEYLWR